MHALVGCGCVLGQLQWNWLMVKRCTMLTVQCPAEVLLKAQSGQKHRMRGLFVRRRSPAGVVGTAWPKCNCLSDKQPPIKGMAYSNTADGFQGDTRTNKQTEEWIMCLWLSLTTDCDKPAAAAVAAAVLSTSMAISSL